ncbi:hypothetical protein FDC26_17705 [Clostridium botulinum]|uniref:hypothetical protein n=1 Tax=unclassified Clostridium TaxID=2614128 RepID=UPI0013CC9EB6|nr:MULTISPECIES: hypothetical protein [unclassified Clostridium]NFN78673.1 hypothetical protein [Clostridium botulinum]NFO79213.1 hypothetical protein [Clostridium botulinum]NFP05977.1 hypothetical protein [Clostridium botulinum]NFS02264.1 hypothetical protein [Clostridium botulinum]NFT97351.1 hypothetical protein [Clostridium botulinum]
MDQVIIELLNTALNKKHLNSLSKLEEKIINNSESDNSEALTELEMLYFKLGLKAGINLVKEFDK